MPKMPKILLIDDDLLVIRSINKLLSKNNYEVKIANNALEAIALVARFDFDLVISDIRMPGDNGIVAAQKIKEIYSERGVRCGYILITGYAEEDTPEHAIRLGINKFLFKPFNIDVLLRNIQEELELLEEERKLKLSDKEAAKVLFHRSIVRDKCDLKRAVITGIGIVAPNGIGKAEYWKGLRDGRNSVDRITFFDPTNFPSQMAAEIRNFEPASFISDPTEIKRMARSSHLAIAGAKLALEDAEIALKDSSEFSIVIGSATAGVEYLVPDAYAFAQGGLSKVRPYVGIAGFVGSISSEVSRAIGAHGLSLSLSDGCTSSNDAMGYALRLIQYGYCGTVITGGADACINDGIVAAFCRMGATSTRNHEPKKASRPFNRDRDGFVISEGSWIFVLEELEHALKRKAKIYAELLGYGATCDAWHMAQPYPTGEFTASAIRLALEDAAISPEEVDIFEAYGNSTVTNDSYETSIIKQVFGKHAYKLVVPSVKSMIGHAIGAAGAAQVAAALLALCEGFVHPTINYEVPDPECDLNYVPNEGRKGEFRVAVCNSLAFGGKNATVVIKSFSNGA